MNMTTSNEIETPSFGGKMRASWGAAVTRAVNAHEAELQSLRRTGKWESARFEEWTTPRPFEVRQVWVSEEGSTAKVAKWCIYLPANSLYVANTAVDATDGLTAADGAPEGWYELPEFPGEGTSGPVYLHVTLPDEESEEGSGEETESEGEDESHEAEAEIVTEFGEQGERDVYIEIASVASDGKVLQKVVGTLVVGDKRADEAVNIPTPDDVSVNFTGQESESGNGTDGAGGGSNGIGSTEGEGGGEDPEEEEQAKKLQIKNWDNGESDDEANNLADLVSSSDGEPHTDNGNYELIARKTDGEEKVLKYLPLGTLKKTVEKVESTVNAGSVSILFTYTDGTTTEVILPAARNGRDGAPGAPGDTPEITADKIETTTIIYADGELIAQIEDGHVPNFTAENRNGTVTLYADGVALVSWNEGTGGGEEMAWDTVTAITGISFKIESGKLKAVLTKTSFNVPNTFDLHPVTVAPTTEVEVCDVEEVDVVTSESYSTSTHAFTNERKRVKVLGAQLATGQTPFTATPLSGE